MKYFIVRTNLYRGGDVEEILTSNGDIKYYDKTTAETIADNKTMHDWQYHYFAVEEKLLAYYRKNEKLAEQRTKYRRAKEAARQEAIDWQTDFPNHDYTWGEIAEYQTYFERLGRRYGLLREFRENLIC